MSELYDLVTNLSLEKRKLLEMLLKEEGVDVSDLPIVPRPTDTISVPLSFTQERLWFLDQFEPGLSVYNLPTPGRLTGTLDVVALEWSLNAIAMRHEALRTTFVSADGEPMQHIAAALTLPLPVADLRGLPAAEREREVQRRATAEAQRPFDLAQGPLVRAALLQLDEEDHILLLTMHHIVSDGWSMAVFNRELSAFYNAFVNDKPVSLPELPIQYADFAVWQHQWLQGPALDQHLAYWTQQLDDLPVLALPMDRSRPAIQTYQGATCTFEISKPRTDALKAISRQEGATLFMTLLAALNVLLHRYTGQDDIVVGSAVANRNRVEVEGLIGFFVNTLVLRTDCSGNASFLKLLSRVREITLDAYAHEDLPFEKLVDALQPERDLSHQALFQLMFVLQDATTVVLESPNLSNTPVSFDSGTSMFDLTLAMRETEQGLVGKFEYATSLFKASTITRMVGHLQTVLQAIAVDPNQCIADIPLLTEGERHQLLVEWNATEIDYPKDQCLHHLFEAQVARTPDALAVVFEDERLTYGELNGRANQLAHYLQTLGVGPDVLVGICVERSLEMVVSVLGVLKAGGAYVPLDPAYPPERLAFMLADTQTPVLLSQQPLVAQLPDTQARLVCLDTDWSTISQQSSENPVSNVVADDLAYVIYTSGSTGRPKGVLVPHRGVVSLLHGLREQPGFSSQDTLLSVTTLSFDIVVSELFLPLSVGARLVVASRDVVSNGRQLLSLLESSGATFLQPTPSTWKLLLEAGWQGSSQLTIICTGEAMPRELANQLLPKGASLWNLYGPTETTIWSTGYHIESEEGPILIGRPMANTQVYVLDAHLQPVPVGVPGELHIGGVGVARGYLHRPELTAERFIHNPFSDDPGSRLYKTGDLVRYLTDGTIECLGRLDDQVKLRGFRIELGEIETVLSQHPAVEQTVVVAREDMPGNPRLVAYIVTEGPGEVADHELRQGLREQLPDYMVPSAFVRLEALPLTPNGKLDRRALPAPDSGRPELGTALVAPRDAFEVQLTKLWEKVLGREPIGMRDNFFELGGHSLLAVQLVHRIEQGFGKTLPVIALFQAPTVEGVAEALREEDRSWDWASVMPLQPNGSKPPFFFLSGRHHVGDRLGPDQPVYRLVYQDLDREQPLVRVEDMAAHSIKGMRTIQPDGPYYLGGHGFGGTVAFEMAHQLQRQGQQVALLALCESWAPGSRQFAPGTSSTYQLWQRAKYYFPRALRSGSRQEIVGLLRNLKKKTQRVAWRRQAVRRQAIPWTRSFQSYRAAVIEALRRYVPQVYSGRITVVRGTERAPWRNDDPLKGWGHLATDGVEAYGIPGSHTSIYKEPNVGTLARTLNEVLRKAQTREEAVGGDQLP